MLEGGKIGDIGIGGECVWSVENELVVCGGCRLGVAVVVLRVLLSVLAMVHCCFYKLVLVLELVVVWEMVWVGLLRLTTWSRNLYLLMGRWVVLLLLLLLSLTEVVSVVEFGECLVVWWVT